MMACPVCFGGDDPVVRESLNAGIGVLLGVTGIVLGCFARFFLMLAKRSREAAHLVGEVRLKPDTTIGGVPLMPAATRPLKPDITVRLRADGTDGGDVASGLSRTQRAVR